MCVYIYTCKYGTVCSIKKNEGGFVHTITERSLHDIMT